MHGKNKDISDLLSNLMKQHLSISMKQNEFKNSLENESLIGASRQKIGEDSANWVQLMTVASILYFMDISIPENKSSSGYELDSNREEGDLNFLYSTEEYKIVLELMLSRMESLYEIFKDTFGDSDTDPIYSNLEIVLKTWFPKDRPISKASFISDDTSTEAFEDLVGYIMIKDNK